MNTTTEAHRIPEWALRAARQAWSPMNGPKTVEGLALLFVREAQRIAEVGPHTDPIGELVNVAAVRSDEARGLELMRNGLQATVKRQTDLLRDWMQFASDVSPGCLAGAEWLDELKAKTQAVLKQSEQPPIPTIDLDHDFWVEIKESAKASKWMPKEYMMNHWVSDVCHYLRHGGTLARQWPPAGTLRGQIYVPKLNEKAWLSRLAEIGVVVGHSFSPDNSTVEFGDCVVSPEALEKLDQHWGEITWCLLPEKSNANCQT